jgi:hypothetical protein
MRAAVGPTHRKVYIEWFGYSFTGRAIQGAD